MTRTVTVLNITWQVICTACHDHCEVAHHMLHHLLFQHWKGHRTAVTFFANFIELGNQL